MTRSTWLPALVVALLLPLAACGDDRPTLQVLAAASLTEAFTDLATEFEEQYDVDVRLSLGSSTDLAEQAADGAPGDVLTTADPTAMQIAVDAAVVGEPAEFATNRLVIVTSSGNPLTIRDVGDLAGTTWTRCADEVPCGRLASRVLSDAGVTAQPASLETDVKATLDRVLSGEADAALVYRTDAVATTDRVSTVPIEDSPMTSYQVAPLDGGDADLAAQWIEHLTGPAGREALENAGFGIP